MLEPYTYILQIPGKEIRSKLIEAFNIWLDVPTEDLLVIQEVVRKLHTASLLYVDGVLIADFIRAHTTLTS